MKCFCCGSEMILGEIASSHPILFRALHTQFLHNNKVTNRFKVYNGNFLHCITNGYVAEAYYCTVCKAIIVPDGRKE